MNIDELLLLTISTIGKGVQNLDRQDRSINVLIAPKRSHDLALFGFTPIAVSLLDLTVIA